MCSQNSGFLPHSAGSTGVIGPLRWLLVLLDAREFAVLVILSISVLGVIRGGCGRGSWLAVAGAVHSYPASPPAPMGREGSGANAGARRLRDGVSVRGVMCFRRVALATPAKVVLTQVVEIADERAEHGRSCLSCPR